MANPLDQLVTPVRSTTDFKIPSIPDLGAMMREGVRLTEALSQWQAKWENWREQLERQVRQLAQTGTGTTGTQTVTTVTQPVFQRDNKLTKQVADLSDLLNQHIAANVVHGTESPVVGQTDEGVLEAKTIGFDQPRNGKFRHVLQYNRIDANETFRIPTNYSMVVAGEFIVNGELIIDGALGVV